jgi:hypothetical protein
LGDKIKEEERGGACSTHRREEKGIRPSVVIPEEKEPFGRYKRRWDDNVKMDVKEKYGRTQSGLIWLRM